MKCNLVIVRAGDSSLHPRWLKKSGNRSWDLIISYFGDDPELYRRPDVERIDSKGPKWQGLASLLSSECDRLKKYEYIWLPDDDIDCSASDIDKIFSFMQKYRLLYAQPALGTDSFFSWPITVCNPATRLRYTNFVEVMVPCFERDFLFSCLPSMTENLSGWGLDWLWSREAAAEARRVAIIDAVRVIHTRPVGGSNYDALRKSGMTAWDELREFRKRYSIQEDAYQEVQAVVTRGGWYLDGRSRMAQAGLGVGYASLIASEYARRRPNRWEIDKALRDHISAPTLFPPRRMPVSSFLG